MFKNMRPMTIFASGVLFGTAGLKLLGCRDARKVYAHAVAAGLRAKDSLMNAVTVLREHTSHEKSTRLGRHKSTSSSKINLTNRAHIA